MFILLPIITPSDYTVIVELYSDDDAGDWLTKIIVAIVVFFVVLLLVTVVISVAGFGMACVGCGVCSVMAFRLMEYYRMRRQRDTVVVAYEVIPGSEEVDLEQPLMVSSA
jgi:hypothetical protein